MKNEGWAMDITTRNKTHYYKNGVSLCGKAKEKKFFKYFDKNNIGSVSSCHCKICIDKQKEMSAECNVDYKRFNY